MNAVLIACTAATLFMVGVAWFVQVVHYPLFAEVGGERFPAYHEAHSKRTTWVVAPVMSVELVTSLVLAFDPPSGSSGLAIAGAVLALGTWVLTGLFLAPAHGRIGRVGWSDREGVALVRASWPRTALWTAHGAVVLAIVAVGLSG